MLIRSIMNIHKGYELNNGTYIVDRTSYYTNIINDLNEQMRINQYSVDQMNVQYGDKDDIKVPHESIDEAG